MKYRLSKIYTRSGDKGTTHFRNTRISKSELLIEAVGVLDELNSQIGFLIALLNEKSRYVPILTQIQHDLFNVGGELHCPEMTLITQDKVDECEKLIDEWNETLPALKEFLLPQGNLPSTACHIARTICRRAERIMVAVHEQVPLNNLQMLMYLNRLSDLLFVLARMLSTEDQRTENLWARD